MKYLLLNKNYEATVDDDIYELVHMYKWHVLETSNSVYVRRLSHKTNYKDIYPYNGKLHHFVAGFPLKGYEVDHIDGNGLNNQRSNLRLIFKYQNPQNRNHRRSSKFPGVSWASDRNKWRACIQKGKITTKIGSFNTEEEAFIAYTNALLVDNKELLPEYKTILDLIITEKETQNAP